MHLFALARKPWFAYHLTTITMCEFTCKEVTLFTPACPWTRELILFPHGYKPLGSLIICLFFKKGKQKIKLTSKCCGRERKITRYPLVGSSEETVEDQKGQKEIWIIDARVKQKGRSHRVPWTIKQENLVQATITSPLCLRDLNRGPTYKDFQKSLYFQFLWCPFSSRLLESDWRAKL